MVLAIGPTVVMFFSSCRFLHRRSRYSTLWRWEFFVENIVKTVIMADSDDETDKRNVREKFKHERNDYDKHESRKSHDVTDRYVFTLRMAIVCGFSSPG